MFRPVAAIGLALGILVPLASGSSTSTPRPPSARPVRAVSATATGTPVAPGATCVKPPSDWSLTARVNELLMVIDQFSNLGASAREATAGVGGFVMLGQPPAGSGPSIAAGTAQLTADAVDAGRVAPWMSTHEEGGPVARLSNVIGPYPSARQMASQMSPAQVTAVVAREGAAMRSLGAS